MRFIGKVDIKEGAVIKGLRYDGVKKIGDPFEIVKSFYEYGIDEIFLVNITGSLYGYSNFKNILNKVCKNIFVPVTIGGGIKNLDDIKSLFDLGADKIALNSVLFENKELIFKSAKIYGSQSISVVVQAKYIKGDWYAFKNMAREDTGYKINEWCKICVDQGCGELIIISVDDDGLCRGLNKNLLDNINIKNIPIVMSGGFNLELDKKFFFNKLISGISFSNYFYKKKFNIIELKRKINYE